MSVCGYRFYLWLPKKLPVRRFLFLGIPNGKKILHLQCRHTDWQNRWNYRPEMPLFYRGLACHNLKFWVFFFPSCSISYFRAWFNYVASKGDMALYAGFHNQILPPQSGAWRFCREPSGCDLAYKKDMSSTFATQFISDSPKADVRIQGREDLV